MSEGVPEPRREMPSPQLDREAFRARFLEQFLDPGFAPLGAELDRIADAAFAAYEAGRKSPRTCKAGAEFADPDFDLPVDWADARRAVKDAEARRADPASPPSILVVNCSPRSEHTCPGETSKTFRLAEIAISAARERGVEAQLLDLSRLASAYGRKIHPCKACFSTAAALCHWPCSCYPNYALGQTQDWMNEIYPMWAGADGVMIVTPVHWYMASSPLKLMMDRLVCADGGNPDITSSGGKDPRRAKAMELAGWDYPRHLAGRRFAVVVHGDVEGAENVRRAIADWLEFMRLRPAGTLSQLDRYIGYWKPYATSHEALDDDESIRQEVRNAALALAAAVLADRAGQGVDPEDGLSPPRQK